MKKFSVFILACFFPWCVLANTAFYQYHSGNHAIASGELKKLAAKNNKQALYYLANMYFHGYAVAKNSEKGIELMRRSGELKYLPAQMFLAKYYLNEKQDLKQAFYWFKKAADKGQVKAQVFTVIAYLEGYGVKKNLNVAKKYVIMAAKNNNPMAQYVLSLMFLQTKHRMNKKMGRIWLSKAAEQNYSPAQYVLGMMLLTGKDIEKNPQQGMEWLKKSAQQKNDQAKLALAKLTKNESISNIEFIKNGINNINKSSTGSDQLTPYQSMLLALKKANIVFASKKVVVAKPGVLMMMPKLVAIGKQQIVKPDFTLADPRTIPIQNFISYMAKKNYKNEKVEVNVTHYKFVMPRGATDYAQAQKLLMRQAQHGYAPALFKLGQMYQMGLGVTQDDKKAFEYYTKAAEQNYLKADYAISLFYLQGKVVEKNHITAIKWLAKAALKGSAQAQYVLGNIYEYGLSAPDAKQPIKANVSKAAAMYNLAAHNGFAVAKYRLAQLYASGLLNPNANADVEANNLRIAYRLYQQANKNDITGAQVALAYFYALKSNDEEKQQWAYKIASREASKGNESAQFILAILYDRGIGVSKSPRSAWRLYKKLAERGNIFAQCIMGTYYYLDNDKKEAINLLTKAANQGSVYAQYNLAVLAYKKQYKAVGEDFISLLKRVAKENYSKANILLADYYLMQHKDLATMRTAAKIYLDLANKGDSIAELKLGFMYERGILFKTDYKQALIWYGKSAQHKNPIAQYLIGKMYLVGKGVPRDVNQAQHYFKLSARQDYAPAQVGLGFIYESHHHDYAEAKKWYSKAAKQNNPQAQYNLALVYRYGKGVTVNDKEAAAWYEKAANNGYMLAQTDLATLYLKGRGVSQDSEQARHWYSKAAKQGGHYALYQLGLINESGVGEKISLVNARLYYQQAVEKGSVRAELALARFYEFGLAGSANKKQALKYYRSAAAAGNSFASSILKKLNTEEKSNFDNKKYCINKGLLADNQPSVWTDFVNLFTDSPNIMYMQAIDNLNAGKTQRAVAKLKKIIVKYPGFVPAKKLYKAVCSV